jgi:uncharacterized protein (TIGR03083 family)
MSEFDKDRLVSVLRAEWAAIDELLAGLSEQDWAGPGGLPGWSVQDVIAHVIGTESMLLGHEVPEADLDPMTLPHVHNEIGAVNERWISAMRAENPAAVLARFREVTAQRTKALEAMTQDDFDAPSWTPAGQATYGRFMRIRLFDCWFHEQDIRHALGFPDGGPGPCTDTALDEITAAIGYVVGKRGKAPDGSSVTFELTGHSPRTVHVLVDGKAKQVPELPNPATVTIRLDVGLFARLAGGRTRAAEHRDAITLNGDTELGGRIVDNLAYTI